MAVGKHLTLAIELEKDILAGKYGYEGGLPSASELAQTHSLSINTVKSALAVLEGKDIIEKRGIGYYVNIVPTTMTQHVPAAHLRYARGGYSENIGSVKRIPLPKHLAEKLRITRGEPVVYRVQISGELVDGSQKPLQITHRYYFILITDEKMKQIQDDTSYDPLWNDASYAIEMVTHDEVTPRLATEGERDLLNLPESTPVTNLFETIRSKDGELLIAQEIVLSPRRTLMFDYPFTNHP
jgi:DNA-binding GntR family transcriptional regulator